MEIPKELQPTHTVHSLYIPKEFQCGNSNTTTGRTKDIYMHEQWWIGHLGMSNNEVGLEVADVPSSSEMHESDSSDTENPPSSEDEESTPNLEHVLNYLNSFDMANGLRSGKVLTNKKRENASHKRHRKPQRKKDQSWRVGGEDGDGMPVVKSISEASEYGSSQNWIGPLAAHCGCHFLLVDHQTLNKYKVS